MKKIIWIFLLLFLVVVYVRRCTYSENKERVFIKDRYGRSMIFHGVNVNADAKSDPLRVGWPKEQDYADLSQKWGFNFVRYLVLWDGIEPEKGKYDTAYFKRIKERLDWCQKHDLKVVLDMHQDLYALRYGGDGAPDWAVIHEDQPFEMQKRWELNYRQPAVITAINNFWDDERGHGYLKEHYIRAFVAMVKEFKDHPAVIGYDLYNEPTMATAEFLSFEKKYLTPFYDKLIKAIRQVDDENWIFFEPSALGANQGFKTGLGALKDYREGEPRLVYFPHLYTLDLDVLGKYIGFPVFINFWAASSSREAKKRNTPLLVGEFGLNLSSPGAMDFLKSTMEMFDKTTGGWAYWAYMKNDGWSPFHHKVLDPFTDDDKHLEAKNILVRPYPRAVSGHPVSYGFDEDEKRFWLYFVPDYQVKMPTEIYLPQNDYPQGWTLEANIDQKLITQKWDANKRVLSVVIDPKAKKDLVQITIVPK